MAAAPQQPRSFGVGGTLLLWAKGLNRSRGRVLLGLLVRSSQDGGWVRPVLR